MAALLGITFPDLLGAPPGVLNILPSRVLGFIRQLSLVPTSAGVADGAVVHSGFAQLPDDLVDLGPFKLLIPGLQKGLPFRFFNQRAPQTAGEQIESQSGNWVLQIDCPEIFVPLPFEPGRFVPETETSPAFIKKFPPDPPGGQPPPLPKPDLKLIVDGGVLEITSDGDFRVRPDFSLHPGDTSGDLVRFRVDPPGFFIRGLGLYLPEGVIDLSGETSPSAALVAGFGDDFQGLYLKELSLFFPRNTPGVGKLLRSLGLREALIGNAYAGEAFLELGPELANTPPVPTFLQVLGNETRQLAFDKDTNKLTTVTVAEAFARVIAVADVNTPWRERRSQARWLAPDGETYLGARTPPFQVRPGDAILHDYVAAEGFEPPPSRTIKVDGVVSPGAAARIQLRHAGHTFEDVTFLAATPEWLAGATLHVTGIPSDLDFNWLLNLEYGVPGKDPTTGEQLPFHFPKLNVKDGQRVGVSAHGHNRFIILDVIGSGDPIIVSQGHASDELGNAFTFNRFGAVYHLAMALAKGELRQLDQPVPDVPEGGGLPELQPGRLYDVFFERLERTEVPGQQLVRVMIMLFYTPMESSNPVGIAFMDDENRVPKPVLDPTQIQYGPVFDLLRERLADLESGTILVVGRSSRTTDTDETNLSDHNIKMQAERAANAHALVKRALPPGTGGGIKVIDPRGEQFDGLRFASETDVATWDKQIGESTRAAPKDTFGKPRNDPRHTLYQRADIYIRRAVFRTRTSFEDRKVSRRALLPGPPDAPNPPVASLPADGRLRRIRGLARWDREPFPVKLEALVVVELSKLAIPIDEDLHTDPDTTTDPCEGDAEDADFLRFLLRLVFDERTGQARWTGAVDSAGDKDGLKRFCNTRAFGLLLLAGPMLAADPPVGEADGATLRFIAVGALLPAAFLLTRGDEPVIRNVDVTIHGVSFELDAREGPFSDPVAVRFKLDYSVAFEVHEKTFGLKSKTNPNTGKVTKMTARFREVGLEIRDLGDFDSPADIGLDNFSLLFDPSKGGSIEIIDPGAFDLDGPLGKLLGITAARIGHGSLFFEFDMAFLLDLGVVEVTQATLRISFGEDGPSAELRGLKVGVDIDQVIVGEGELKVLDGGQIKAALDLEVVPAGVKASGQLDLLPQADFTAVGVALDVEYATGLPLGSTGLGIYGFFGLFAANMARNVDRLAPNRVTAELAWLNQILRGVGSPWVPQRQAWAFGVGAVVGTLPDSARSFHAKGGLVLELPGPGVIFGIDAAFLKKRRKAKKPDLTGTMTGLALVDPFAYLIGIEVNLKVGKFLTLHIPTSAFFPRKALPGETAIRPSFVRIGQDGVDPGGGRPPRLGAPARASLTAGSFGNVAEVFAFLMIEEEDLLDLGGEDDLDFNGFSVGLGIGAEVRWGSKRVGLEASALLLVGLGTSPLVLAGKFKFKGTLRLLVYSLSVSALVDFRHDDSGTVFNGEFCGKISFFFFSVEGCVPLHLGDGNPFEVLAPPLLVAGLSLVDRRGQEITGGDVDPDGGPLVLPTPVWPDAVPVLHFNHEPATALDPAGPFHASLHNLEYSQEVLAGDFTYVFTLKDLRLEKRVGGAFTLVPGALPSAWWFPSWRPAFLDGAAAPPSGEEARELGLLTWHPAPWARSLIPDQQQDTLDDIRDSIANACDDKVLPAPDCILGGNAVPGPGELEWQATSERAAFRLVLTDQQINDEPPERAISTLLALGFHFEPAQVHEWGVDHVFDGRTLRAGLRLARGYRFQQVGGFLRASFCFTSLLRPTRPQRRPELVLAINLDEFRDDEPPGPGIEVFADPNGFPLVRAVRAGGEVDLRGELAATLETPTGTFMLIRYRYDLDDLAVSAWRVMAYRGDVQVMLACGQDAGRAHQVEEANQDRQAWIQGLLDYFQTATFSTQQFVLDAGTEYRVLVDWTWTGRHRLGSPTPELSVTQELRFTTAAAAGPDQQRTILEQDVFDPRALSGYVLAQPTLEDPPAFLDDPVRVHFSVGHLTELLDRYHRDFKMEVRRTDVPAAPVTEGGGALNLLFQASFHQKLTDAVDVILADAIFQSACLGGTEPPLGGTEGEIAFDMAPDAGYELRVLAPDRLDPDEPQEHSLFVRAPFRSSHFRNPLELFAALGFGTPSDPGVQYPADHVLPVEFTPPALPARPGDDAELGDALHQFGLDALETPTGPRTTLLWTPRPDGTFQVIGLLLEAPEPIERGPRLAVQSVELRSEPLDLVRSTRAGDRLLFAPSTPVAIPPDTASELDIVYTENGGPQQRARRIVLAAPVAVLWEA
jgi:hypothetical protein